MQCRAEGVAALAMRTRYVFRPPPGGYLCFVASSRYAVLLSGCGRVWPGYNVMGLTQPAIPPGVGK